MIFRIGLAGIALAALLAFGQEPDWQTEKTLPGVDFNGLSPQQKALALKVLRDESCVCGCSMKVAECRVKDPACGVSRALSTEAMKAIRDGKSEVEVRKAVAELAKKGPPPPKTLEDPVTLNITGAPSKGPANARITLVEFSDFQCPYCAVAAGKLYVILSMYPKDVRLVYKQFPLDSHPQARLAAEASLAANAQGKFWELHDKMYANYRKINKEAVMQWATEAGLDMKRFTAEMTAGKYRAQVQKELEEGVNAGVQGTPSLFIDGKHYNGAIDPQALKPILDEELRAGGSK